MEWALEVLKCSNFYDDFGKEVDDDGKKDKDGDDGNDDGNDAKKRGKRIVRLPANLRSPFLMQNDNALSNTVVARKRIVDYSFSNLDPE